MAWSEPSTVAATGVHHGYRSSQLVDAGRPRSTCFADVLAEFAPVYEAWVSWIDPGGFILLHCDAGPYRERWQVPISTAGGGPCGRAVDGQPFRVHQWEPHHVVNDTGRPRIHLVIDRDVIVDDSLTPFTVYEEPPYG